MTSTLHEANDDRATAPLTLSDGRILGYRVYGDPQGAPVYFFHGLPGSHEQAALVTEQAARAGVALVAFDRPGFGDSSPLPGAGFAAIVNDTAELAAHLGHGRFAALGVSCGGPYALACARLLGRRVTGVGLLAGIAPMDRPELRRGQLPPLRLMFGLARRHAWLINPLLALDRLMFRSPERAVRALAGLLTAPDRALLERDTQVRQRFGHSLARAYAQGIAGAREEARRIAGLGSDSLADIHVPVQIYQSGQDRNVPPAMGAYMAAHLPTARLHPRPAEGHLSIVVHCFEDCIRRLLPTQVPHAADAPQL
ncbi:alpha/beta fold hydrolase [Paucibacter sp. M5-1]|uniref:alpha/beta fold hydrolase n=1 Tax=Paucibacter sp. M5-1 TaxID=3015998 RepID=UPI0022B887E4|nr:alpha/beta fold hydrolase [Paucibacter sp. M5-1]MCZ7880089.1 alpha/beta fold hydrolase [Paucibacter sp. M5-1]